MTGKNDFFADAARVRKAFLLLLVLFISALFVSMIRQFIMTILLAAITSGLLAPLFARLVRAFRGRRALASVVTILVTLLVIVVPLGLVLGVCVGQAVRLTNTAGPWVEEQVRNPDRIAQWLAGLPFAEHVAPYRAQVITKLGEVVGHVGNFLVAGLSSATKGTVAFLFHVFLFLYTMFFFLTDGERILRRILYFIPLPDEDEARMVGKFVSVTRATLKGTLVIGVLQGGLAATGFAVAGIGSTVFWGVLMAILSVVPGLGTALVWVPAVIYLGATGKTLAAILLAVWCAAVVGSVDNVVRPWLVGKDTQMHDLLILFSTLGGLLFFGLPGFIIGPILAALFVTAWDMYGVAFADVLPPSGGEPDGGE
jgi:predicted PurR-regulated permease PerM